METADGRLRAFWAGVGVFVLATLWFFVSSLVTATIITTLPRPTQGEAPAGSEVLSLAIVLLVQCVPPCLLTMLATKSRRVRLAGIIAIMSAIILSYYILDGFDFLDKAWRRGV